ncbi:MAG: hypothetical protein ACRDEA_02130, partial [Microcystaceae cyanobacterium]
MHSLSQATANSISNDISAQFLVEIKRISDSLARLFPAQSDLGFCGVPNSRTYLYISKGDSNTPWHYFDFEGDRAVDCPETAIKGIVKG